MFRTSFVLLTAAIMATSASAKDYSGNTDFTSTYESSGGMVTFPHGSHAEKLSTKCNFCHSALRTFGGISEMYGHKLCKFCHENNGGPKGCTDCHDTEKKAPKK